MFPVIVKFDANIFISDQYTQGSYRSWKSMESPGI